MNKYVGFLILAAIGIIVAAWYWLWYLPSQNQDSDQQGPPAEGSPCTLNASANIRSIPGIIQNGVCVPAPSTRMTAIQANNIVNKSATKDSLGYPTISFNGDFYRPDLSNFPPSDLQNLLKNGWWISLLTGGTLNGYQAGNNGNYLVAIYDVQNPAAAINSGKSQIVIPATLQPYLIS